MRREFSSKIKVAAFRRADGRCEKCSVRLSVGKFAYDHRIPDAMGGEPTLDNCEVLCTACHSAKTRTVDVPRIAKARRQAAKHIGIKRPSSFRKPPEGSRWDWRLGRRVFDTKEA